MAVATRQQAYAHLKHLGLQNNLHAAEEYGLAILASCGLLELCPECGLRGNVHKMDCQQPYHDQKGE